MPFIYDNQSYPTLLILQYPKFLYYYIYDYQTDIQPIRHCCRCRKGKSAWLEPNSGCMVPIGTTIHLCPIKPCAMSVDFLHWKYVFYSRATRASMYEVDQQPLNRELYNSSTAALPSQPAKSTIKVDFRPLWTLRMPLSPLTWLLPFCLIMCNGTPSLGGQQKCTLLMTLKMVTAQRARDRPNVGMPFYPLHNYLIFTTMSEES